MDLAEKGKLAEHSQQELVLLAAERDAYQQELFETERHSAWLSMQRQTLADRCHELEDRCRQLEDRCRRLEDRCRQVEASFVQSTSWRLTAPLRALSRLRRKF
jgi:hypothetical protein